MNTNRSHILAAVGSTLVTLLASITTAQASAITAIPPNQFTSGSTISSSVMNTNFQAVVSAVNDNNTRIGTAQTNITNLTTNKQNRVTGTCVSGNRGIQSILADGTVTCTSGFTGYASVTAFAHSTSFFGNTMSAGYAGGYYGRYQSSGTGDDRVLVPVQLPHGATITGFTYICYDNYALGTCQAWFYRGDGNSIAYVTSSVDSTVAQTLTTTTISNATVDNSSESYFIWMSTNGTAGSNIMPLQANITYTMP